MESLHRQAKGWELIPEHLLDMIMEKLNSAKDSLNLGAVCPKWHSIFKDNQIKVVEKLRQCQAPMLLFPDEDETTIYNVMDGNVLSSKLSVPYEKRFSGSSHGWLVSVSADLWVTLYKPFSMSKGETIDSKNTVRLPRLDCVCDALPLWALECRNNATHKVLITSDPVDNPEDCIVCLIVDPIGLVFTRLAAKDRSWTPIEFDEVHLPSDVIVHKNLIYALTNVGDLYSIDFENPTTSIQEFPGPDTPDPGCSRLRYLVDSNCGNLWIVERFIKLESFHETPETMRFKIFKFSFDEGAWIRLKSIGNRALFLGDNSTICVNVSEVVGCKPNCIYFTNAYHDWGTTTDIGIYNITTKEMDRGFGDGALILSRNTSRIPIWVVPTFTAY